MGKRRRNQHAKFCIFVRVRYVDSEIRACVSENVFALYGRTEWARTIKFKGDVENIKLDRLFKFGAFMSSCSGDIGKRNLKNSLQNGR